MSHLLSCLGSLLVLVVLTSGNQPETDPRAEILDYRFLSLSGITGQSCEPDLVRTFGQPDTFFDPQFECGAFSKDWSPELETVWQYEYPGLTFVLVDSQVFFKEIRFAELLSLLVLRSERLNIDQNTTWDDFAKAYPQAADVREPRGDFINLYQDENYEERTVIYFSDGKVDSLLWLESC